MIRTEINIREIKLEGKNKPKSRKKSREKKVEEFMKRLMEDTSLIDIQEDMVFPEK